MRKIYIKNNRGQAILISIVVLGSIVLSITTIAGYLSIQRIRSSRDIVDSAKAIYAADTGIELEAYKRLTYEPLFGTSTPSVGINVPGVSFEATSTETGGQFEIRSIGTSGKVGRGFRVNINKPREQ